MTAGCMNVTCDTQKSFRVTHYVVLDVIMDQMSQNVNQLTTMGPFN